jgi:hypothetical protein
MINPAQARTIPTHTRTALRTLASSSEDPEIGQSVDRANKEQIGEGLFLVHLISRLLDHPFNVTIQEIAATKNTSTPLVLFTRSPDHALRPGSRCA